MRRVKVPTAPRGAHVNGSGRLGAQPSAQGKTMTTIEGNNGKDLLIGTNDADLIDGGNGADTLTGGGGDDTLIGGNGDDTLTGGAGNDTLYGGNSKDTAVYSGSRSNYLFELLEDGGIRVFDSTGADGDDVVYDVSYFQFADGTVNADDLPFGEIPEPPVTVDYSWTTQGVEVDLVANTATGPDIPGGSEPVAASVVNVIGGSGNDILRGDPGDNQLFGGDGDDLLTGGLGGNDLFDGGNGLDRVSFSGAANPVNVQLAAGVATIGGFTKTFQSIELVRGTNQDDTFDATGFSGASANAGSNGTLNEFEGLDGDDTITGNGNTRVSYLNADGGVTVTLGAGGSGSAFGTAPGDSANVGTDTFVSGVSRVRGSEFGDRIFGNGGNNTLEGRGGNDVLRGNAGDDTLDGGVGGIDIARFSGVRSEYTITPGGVPGSSTIADNVAGRNGTDTLTGIELTEFDNTYVLNQRVLDLGTFDGLVPGKQILGTNLNNAGVGDNLTLGLNANGRVIDLAGGGTDTLTLQEFGTPVYNLNLFNVESLVSTGGIDTVNLQNVANGMSVDLGGGFDILNLAAGANTVTVTNIEAVNGNSGSDTIVIAGNPGFVTMVTGGGGADTITASADEDHIRFTAISDSPYDVPGGGLRDEVIGFDASEDKFVFEGVTNTNGNWELIDDGGVDVIRVDVDANATWDMAIEIDGLTGTLTDDNFAWILG
jgi:Ca2+-binding RTX toxin-like protein